MKDANCSLLYAKVLRMIPCLSEVACRYNQHRHLQISQQIEPICEKAMQKGRNKETATMDRNNGPIWVFWWQGMESAPPIVRVCIRSIQKNCGGRRVCILTSKNIRNFVNIPVCIYDKMAAGIISFTHFSDILRFKLLNAYGGIWMDATMYAVKPLDRSEYSDSFFTCGGYPDKTCFNVSLGRWIGFFIGGCRCNLLFQFMNDAFDIYWQQNEKLVDYFLIDYMLDYAYRRNIGRFREYCESGANKFNPNLFSLERKLKQPFDEEQWTKMKENNDVFKLTWKKGFKFETGTYGDYILNS